jgi:hypothetical protein
MTKTLTITVPDDAYRSLARAAADTSQTPEELAARAVTDRFGRQAQQQPAVPGAAQVRDMVLAVMRASGHLASPAAIVPPVIATTAELPPADTPERARLEAEIAEELGDAFQQSGLSLLDLVERR